MRAAISTRSASSATTRSPVGLPFDGETSADVVAQHLTTTGAVDHAASRRSVPPRLAAAVERCLHKEPIRRYRSAESFAEAIDLAFEHAKEIPAPLRVWLARARRSCRRDSRSSVSAR